MSLGKRFAALGLASALFGAFAQAPAAPSAAAVVTGWRLPRTEGVSQAELQRLTQPLLGQALDAAKQRELVDAVRALYESRGLGLVGIAVRPDGAAPGVVSLVVVEPRVGRIELAPMEAAPISDQRVIARLAQQGIRDGALLALPQLDRAMFALNDLPGIGVRASLAPSGDEGRFDITLERTERKRFDATLDADNHGTRFNGKRRAGAFVRWNNPGRVGDNLDARVLVSEGGGLGVGRLAYERPLGDTAWRGSAAASRVTYALGDTLAALEPRGRANVLELGLSRPLIRARDRNLIARVALDRKKLQDRFDAVGVSVDKTEHNASAGLSFELRDELFGGGYNGGSVTAQFGRLRIDTPAESEADAAQGRRATQGNFTKLALQASRLQRIKGDWSAYAGLSAQFASRNLDSAEKFALGGPQAVRAYPPGEAAADEGAIASLELRRSIGAAWSVFGLADFGHAKLQKRPLPDEDNRRSLRAHGVGVFYSDPQWFTLRASLAWRGGELSQSDPDANNPRLYLQVQKTF